METGPRFKVSLDRLVKLGIEPVTPGLQGKRFIHYTTADPGFLTLTHLSRMYTCLPLSARLVIFQFKGYLVIFIITI